MSHYAIFCFLGPFKTHGQPLQILKLQVTEGTQCTYKYVNEEYLSKCQYLFIARLDTLSLALANEKSAFVSKGFS